MFWSSVFTPYFRGLNGFCFSRYPCNVTLYPLAMRHVKHFILLLLAVGFISQTFAAAVFSTFFKKAVENLLFDHTLYIIK